MLARLLLLVAGLAISPVGTPRAWPGELAVVSGARLVVITGHESHAVSGPGLPSEPKWSPDGTWVAFLRSGTQLWAARSSGADAHRVSPAGLSVSEFSWASVEAREILVFSASHAPSGASQAPSATGTVLLASANSTAVRILGTYPDLIGFSVAPSGKQLAISYRAGRPPAGDEAPTWKGVVRIVPLAGGPSRAVYSLPAGGYALLGPGWWPDGKGLLFWDDPEGSASIAADGLPLDSLDLATGKVSTLGTMLTYPNWISWSLSGKQLAFVAGPNRVVWDSGKHLVLCHMPTDSCRPVPLQSKGTMALDPAWAGDGSLVFDIAPGTTSPVAVVPTGLKVTGNAPFDQATVARWYAAMRLWVARLPAATGHPLAHSPLGAHDPLPAPGGIFFLRADSLYWLANGASHPSEVVTGISSPGYFGASSYYGYMAWQDAFAWHA